MNRTISCIAFGMMMASAAPNAAGGTVLSPYPPDGASVVGVKTGLNWTGSGNAVAYDVYLGTNHDNVSNAGTVHYPGDLDNNGQVGEGDLAVLAQHWHANTSLADLTSDGHVDFADFAVMARDWHCSDTAGFVGRLTGQSYEPGTLLPNTTYYWRVDEIEEDSTIHAGQVCSFTTGTTVVDGVLSFVNHINQVDVSGKMVYAINCGGQSDISVGQVNFRADVYQWHSAAGDINGDGMINWWDNRYNANCPGKPTSPTPMAGVTVECSDSETNGMDHGPYETSHDSDVSQLFAGQGSSAEAMANVMSTSGVQNLGEPGDRDMVFRLDVEPGKRYKLQLFFKSSSDSTGMDVVVDGKLAIEGLDLPAYISDAGFDKSATVLLFSSVFAAPDGQVDIVIRRNVVCHHMGEINAITLQALDPGWEMNVVTPDDTVANYDSVLSWNAVAEAVSYNVYFAAGATPVFVGNTSATAFDPGVMTKGQTYSWRIDPVIGGTPSTGVVRNFHVSQGSLKLLNEISDVDLDGCIIQGINCGKSGPVSDASVVIRNVLYKPDILVTHKEYLARDVNGDNRFGEWHDQLYNATNPGKPASPTPIPGMRVECSDSDTNGMDHGPYESTQRGRVTSTIFPGQGSFYKGVYPPADDTAQGLRYLLYHSGVQNTCNLGEQNMVFRLDTIPGHNYKLQLLFFFNEQHDQQQRALNLYIRPDGAAGFVRDGTTEKPEINCNILNKIRQKGGSTDMQTPDAGLVYTYEFVGGNDGRLDFEITRNPDDNCKLALINAIILEDTSPVATDPKPMNAQYYTPWKQKLSWSAATGADSHDVYFGTDYATVRNATITTAGIYKGNQTPTTFDPGNLNMDTTYFWRVDEVDDGVATTGETWSFTPGTDTGGHKVIHTAAGEWIEHHDVKFPAGDFRFTAKLSTKAAGMRVRLDLNGVSHSYSFPVTLPDTGGFMSKVHLGHATLAADRYDMRFVFVDGGVELDYFFERRSSDTTSTVLPEDTLLVPPSGTMEMITVTGHSGVEPCSGWPYSVIGGNGYHGFEFSMDIFNNHDAWNQQFWDYHVDCMLSARIHAVEPHGAGLWDPMGVDDQGPFIGVRPTLPRLLSAINRAEGAREYLKICQFDVASGQVREFYENSGESEPKFNAATDTDQYRYWFDYCIKPFWSMVPRDMWYQRDGHSPWYAWWDAPQGGGWWEPGDLTGHLKNWISYLRQRTTETFGTDLYFVGVGAQYSDNTITSDDVQAICPLMNRSEDTYEALSPDHYYGIGQWNSGRGGGTGNKYANCSPGFRSFDYDDKTGIANDASTFATEFPRHNISSRKGDNSGDWPVRPEMPQGSAILDYALTRMEQQGVTWVNIECWDDKDEDTSELPSTDTRVFKYPNEFINILREHADPQMLSVRFEAELCDFYSDTTPGNSGTDFWQYRADPDSVNGGVAKCDVDIDRITGSDIGIAVNPYPLDCEGAVPVNVVLTWADAWRSEAHEVYFGTDRNRVMTATQGDGEYMGSYSTASFTPPTLTANTTYYWRVDEVYAGVSHPSKTWKFSTFAP